jgi:predicted membrane metal-binding protein
MLLVVVVLRASARHWHGAVVWLSACAAVLVWDPWALLQPGFWLSFVAVGVLMATDPNRLRRAGDAPPWQVAGAPTWREEVREAPIWHRFGAHSGIAGAALLGQRLAALLREEVALALEEVELTGAELLADLAGAALRLVRGLAAALVVVDLLRLGLVRLGLVRPFGLSASPRPVRVRCAKTSAHSASLRLAGLAPWVWATLAAFSISATRFCQEAAKRLSDWDLAPLSIRVSITPSALTFLRRRWKISFCNWAIRASPFSLIWMVS